jgi:uncharacterized membrane protein YozB (DUF420 family)
MSVSEAREDRGVTPFIVFGIALVVGAAWAVYMGVAFSNTPNFVTDALPTIAGVTIAVAAILLIALWAPKNE